MDIDRIQQFQAVRRDRAAREAALLADLAASSEGAPARGKPKNHPSLRERTLVTRHPEA